MSYDLVLCECACGHRVAYPAAKDADVVGFVCDECFVRYQFQQDYRPLRVKLADRQGNTYPMGFLVFSVRRCNTELAEEVVESWFRDGPTPLAKSA